MFGNYQVERSNIDYPRTPIKIQLQFRHFLRRFPRFVRILEVLSKGGSVLEFYGQVEILNRSENTSGLEA